MIGHGGQYVVIPNHTSFLEIRVQRKSNNPLPTNLVLEIRDEIVTKRAAGEHDTTGTSDMLSDLCLALRWERMPQIDSDWPAVFSFLSVVGVLTYEAAWQIR